MKTRYEKIIELITEEINEQAERDGVSCPDQEYYDISRTILEGIERDLIDNGVL